MHRHATRNSSLGTSTRSIRDSIREQVKKFAIIDRELSIEADDLTPSMQLRRKVVITEFADQLAALYT